MNLPFPTIDPNQWILAFGWIFASVIAGIFSGFLIGRWYTLLREPVKLRKDRERTLTAVLDLLSSTDKLTDDVGVHNSALAVAQEDISQLPADGDAEELQGKLLNSITAMVASNRKLEGELVNSRYQLDQQTIQLDATRREARTDALSALGNRKAFDESMAYMASQMKTSDSSYALMLIDVDYFKRINDTFGHAAGDRVLISIGRALVDSVRPDDRVFRIGGDEFGILLKGVTAKTASSVGKRIRSEVERSAHQVKHESTVVTLSMGLTVAEPKDTPETLFVRADEALYRSKELGRNRLTTRIGSQNLEFSPDDQEEESESSAFEFSTYEQFKAEFTESAS